MPIVPGYDNLQVGMDSLPNARLAAPQVSNFGGEQTQQLGKGMQQLGGAMGEIALDMQREVNKTRVSDAQNRMMEAAFALQNDKDTGFESQLGLNALQRPDGKALADGVLDRFNAHKQTIMDGLGNDAQRQAFGLWADAYGVELVGKAVAHEGKQYQAYSLSVAQSAVAIEQRTIALNYNDPQKTQNSVKRIEEHVRRMGAVNGLAPEAIDANVLTATSGSHLTAIVFALQNKDPAGADAYLKLYTPQMHELDLVKAHSMVSTALETKRGMDAVQQAWQGFQGEVRSARDNQVRMAAQQRGSGRRVAIPEASARALQDTIMQVNPDIASSPTAWQTVVAQSRILVQEHQKFTAEEKDNYMMEAYRQLDNNKGDYDALSPETKQFIEAFMPEEVAGLRVWATPTKVNHVSLFNDLLANPQQLKTMSRIEFMRIRPQFTVETYERLGIWRADLINPRASGPNDFKSLANMPFVAEMLNNLLSPSR